MGRSIKHLSFSSLCHGLTLLFRDIPDRRQKFKVDHSMHDVVMSGSKQDCEINAGKRFLRQLRQDHPQMKLTIGGDGLNSKQPFIEVIREERMNFIVVAKPNDHKMMLEWIGEQRQLGEIETKKVDDDKGRTHVYEWINQVPLNGKEDSFLVNFFSYRILTPDENGKKKVTFKYSWVTDFELTSKNVEQLVRAGRCRWRIENECFNTLKNQGYYIEHNYGHGNKNLSFNFLLLTLIAFFCHQIAELTNELYQACRRKCGSKIHMWEKVRGAICWFVFDSWEMLFQFVLDPKPFQPTLMKPG